MRLYVENMPRLADESILRSWFARAGYPVQTVELVRGLSSERSYGVVIIDDAQLARRALRRLNGRPFWGRAIVLRPAV